MAEEGLKKTKNDLIHIWKVVMEQIHILRICWQEANGNEFKTSEKKVIWVKVG